jgi:polyhydroxyalkanoate synthase
MKSSNSTAASLNWSSALHASSLPEMQAPPPREALEDILQADRALIAGIAAYRTDSYFRDMRDPPCVWDEQESRLLDYGGDGPAVLFVPSLINRAYILDLMEDASMLRWLAGAGLHPYLLDWGWPGEVERQFSLTDYVAGRLERAIAALPGPVILAGYCMGGLLALAATQRTLLQGSGKITALALLATPWDFHAADPSMPLRIRDMLPMLESFMPFGGTLPIDALNTLFAMVDPYGVGEKYRDFAAQDKAQPRAQRFVAMEDWLADGVPLAAPVAREALRGWYVDNTPAKGAWRVAGLPVDPRQVTIPSFCAIPARDRLVPAVSAQALAKALPRATVLEPTAGHVGMVAGTRAETSLWRPFADWVHGLR